MGKANFPQIYRKCKKSVGGRLTIKQSSFSDHFVEDCNYAGVVVYFIDGNPKWTNSSGGRADGWRGRAFYAVIQCTDDWPDDVLRDVGQGRVHHYLLEDTFGIEFDQDRIACGGFGYVNGALSFSSVWLNGRDQFGARSNYNKYLNKKEKRLVRYIFDDWEENGPNRVVPVPIDIERSILGRPPPVVADFYDYD